MAKYIVDDIQTASFEATTKKEFTTLLEKKLSPLKIEQYLHLDSLEKMYGPQVETIFDRIKKTYNII